MKYFYTILLSLLIFVSNSALIIPQQNVISCATNPNNIQPVGDLIGVNWTLKVLLVEFQDVRHSSENYSFNDFNNLLFSNAIYASTNMYSPDGQQVFGSLRDYYYKISNGQFIITGFVVNRDDNHDNVPDWLTLPQTKNNYDNGTGDFITDVANAASSAGLDISTDSTTKLVIIYAGQMYRGHYLTPYESGGTYYINSELFAPGAPYNGERSDAKFSEIGVHAHEFGHLLGWTDLYNVDGFGNGQWDLMASGNYNGPNNRGACPAPPDPQLRATQGWLNFIPITNNTTVQSYYYLSNPSVYQIKNSTDAGNYWLIETRDFNTTMQIGSTNANDYNTYTPHGSLTQGVLVWRYYNGIPTLLHASGVEWTWTTTGPGYDGDPYPGSANIKVLAPWTDNRDPSAFNNYWVPNTKPSTNVAMRVASQGSGYFTLNLYYDYQSYLQNIASSNESENNFATESNNQRKLIVDASGNYHEVFTSGGEIFYRNSSDGGFNWSSAIRLSNGFVNKSSACYVKSQV